MTEEISAADQEPNNELIEKAKIFLSTPDQDWSSLERTMNGLLSAGPGVGRLVSLVGIGWYKQSRDYILARYGSDWDALRVDLVIAAAMEFKSDQWNSPDEQKEVEGVLLALQEYRKAMK